MMGQSRRLTRSIVPLSVKMAKISANTRWRKYLHRGARERLARQERAMVGRRIE
jgi:hypothetical protein